MFKPELLEEAERTFHARRKYEEDMATARTREAEAKNETLRALGARRRALGPAVLAESLKGQEGLEKRVQAIRDQHQAITEEYENELVKMGLPADHTKARILCSLCGDTGYADGKMCRCLKKILVRASAKASGIAPLLEKQRFDNFDLSFYSKTPLPDKRYSPRDVMSEILEFCKDWAEHFSLKSPSLLFIGGTGLGKTHLSSAIAGVVLEKAYDVVYESAPRVAATFEKERFEAEEDAIGTRRLLEAELLILDDLGTESPSKATSSAIYHLINTRVLVKGLPTIISTNLTYRQLEKTYEAAVLSRLLGEFSVKFFQGDDVRMAKLKR